MQASTVNVAGVTITHPDRVVYPDAGLTKLDLAKYYDTVATWMLPHVVGRPLTLVFCPQGVSADCAYLKHGKAWGPKALRRVRIQEKTKEGEYMVVESVDGLVSLMQMNWIEAHTWNSTIADIEHPDRLVFDLDPGPKVTWPRVIAAARQVRAALETLRLRSWVKTTGGRGLHVVVPIRPEHDWSECLSFARQVAETMAAAQPAKYTTEFAKAGREASILIDYLRNNRTNTSIAAFSPRARPGATVSVPLGWDELAPSAPPERWTVRTVPRRLARLRADPWAEYWTARQRIR
jgi:bifunctional non-homologous end joining protein LigD